MIMTSPTSSPVSASVIARVAPAPGAAMVVTARLGSQAATSSRVFGVHGM